MTLSTEVSLSEAYMEIKFSADVKKKVTIGIDTNKI